MAGVRPIESAPVAAGLSPHRCRDLSDTCYANVVLLKLELIAALRSTMRVLLTRAVRALT